MPIRCFSSFVRSSELEDLELNNCPLVVDATNYFYNSYEDSGLPYQRGVEADLYAAYLRKQLEGFRRAKVDCYFVFKGGHEDIQRKIAKVERQKDEKPKVRPIFMKEICYEVIDEMGFKSGVCEYESKTACVLLAEHLKCAILSDDIEFCLQPQPYVPYTELRFSDNTIRCKVFSRAKFLTKHSMTVPKLAVFRALTDERYFPFEFFHDFMRRNCIPIVAYKRFQPLLAWLSKNSEPERKVVRQLCAQDKEKFEKAVASALVLPGDATAVGWLLGDVPLPEFGEPEWLAASICNSRLSANIVNMIRSRVLHGDWMSMEWKNPLVSDALAPCLDILQFMLDLLTGGDNDGFVFCPQGDDTVLKRAVPLPKTGLGKRNTGVFEYWARARLGLSRTDLLRLERLPRDAGLLVTSLLLCARAAPGWSRAVAYASLLRHVLGSLTYAGGREISFTPHQQHQLVIAQHALQQTAVLRRLCTDARVRWRDAGRASNAARALADFELMGDPRECVRKDLSGSPALLKEFKLLADTYDELEPTPDAIMQ